MAITRQRRLQEFLENSGHVHAGLCAQSLDAAAQRAQDLDDRPLHAAGLRCAAASMQRFGESIDAHCGNLTFIPSKAKPPQATPPKQLGALGRLGCAFSTAFPGDATHLGQPPGGLETRYAMALAVGCHLSAWVGYGLKACIAAASYAWGIATYLLSSEIKHGSYVLQVPIDPAQYSELLQAQSPQLATSEALASRITVLKEYAPHPGEPTDPTLAPGEPTDPALVPGEPTEPALVPGEPTDPALVPGEPTEPALVPGEPTDPALVPGKPTEPALVPALWQLCNGDATWHRRALNALAISPYRLLWASGSDLLRGQTLLGTPIAWSIVSPAVQQQDIWISRTDPKTLLLHCSQDFSLIAVGLRNRRGPTCQPASYLRLSIDVDIHQDNPLSLRQVGITAHVVV